MMRYMEASEPTVASEQPAPVKRMRLRYAGTCCRCGGALAAGVPANYDREAKTVFCIQCPPATPIATVSATAILVEEPDQPADLPFTDGRAGAGAQSEYQRRHNAREDRVRTAHPKIGGFLLAITDDPQTTKAWASGAVGERKLGSFLDELAGPTLRVMHDRRIPKSRANIDHLVICPSGVWVIDAKRYQNKRPELRIEGGILRPRVEKLYVGGSDKTVLVDGMQKQLEVVQSALGAEHPVPVHGALCFIDADFPLIGGDFTIGGVAVVWRKKLAKLLTAAGPLDDAAIAQAHQHLDRTLRPYG